MKDTILHFLFSSALNWIPFTFFVAMIVAAAYVQYYSKTLPERRRTLFARLIIATICFRIAFAALKTWLQHYAWASDAMGKLLLPPTQSITVFARYAWTHFWINALLSIVVGLLMFVLLRALQKKNDRFFEEGEVELGALMAFVVGWPHFVIFFPLVFIFVVLFSIVRGIALKEPFTTLGMPLIAAAIVALVVALQVIPFLHLSALVI